LPRKLTGLTSLEFLNLTGCEKLSQKPPKLDHPNRSQRHPRSSSPTPGEDTSPIRLGRKPTAPRGGRTGAPGAGKGELASGSRQDRAQVRRPDLLLHEDAGPSRFGHRGLEHQIPAIALLHGSSSTASSRWCTPTRESALGAIAQPT